MMRKGLRFAGIGLSSVMMTLPPPQRPDPSALPPPPPPPPWLQLAEQVQPPQPPSQPQAVQQPPPPPPSTPAPEPGPPAVPPAQAVVKAPAAPEPAPQKEPAGKEPTPPPVPPQLELSQAAERKIREYRFMKRILKSMLLPLLFSLMSFWMLSNYVKAFEPYYNYDFEIIIMGFLVGFLAMNGFVFYNMRIAKREGKYVARQLNGVLIMVAFLGPYVYYMLFINPASAWRFSMGFFISAVITPIMVKAYESMARGKFYIQEEEFDDRLTRTLIFRS